MNKILDIFGKVNENGEFILNKTGFSILIIIMIGIVCAAAMIGNSNNKIKAKQLTYAAIAIALAVVTSYIKIFHFPFGGSITLASMFFICFIGYLYGPKISFTTAIAYGIFQLISDPYIIHPIQLLLDYILGFGALGLSGLFYQSKYGLLKGYLIGVCGRYICSVLSGFIFFSSYAWEGWNPLLYSIVYNGCYIFTEAALTMVLLASLEFKHAFTSIKRLANEG